MTLITSDSLIYEHFDTVQNKVNRFLLSTLRLGQRLAKTGALFLFYSRFYPSRDNLIWEAKLNKLYIYSYPELELSSSVSMCAHTSYFTPWCTQYKKIRVKFRSSPFPFSATYILISIVRIIMNKNKMSYWNRLLEDYFHLMTSHIWKPKVSKQEIQSHWQRLISFDKLQYIITKIDIHCIPECINRATAHWHVKKTA